MIACHTVAKSPRFGAKTGEKQVSNGLKYVLKTAHLMMIMQGRS